MSRKQWFTFVMLSVFPFLLALTFRATDNYFFRLHRQKMVKERTNYFPQSPPDSTEELIKNEFSCQELTVAGDTLMLDAPGP